MHISEIKGRYRTMVLKKNGFAYLIFIIGKLYAKVIDFSNDPKLKLTV
jgi:hypothetical protein